MTHGGLPDWQEVLFLYKPPADTTKLKGKTYPY